ncbi:MAG: AAA family ATPase [Clostridia bacterium]
MALSKEQWNIEESRLREIFSLITQNITNLEEKVGESISQIRASNKIMWNSGKSYHYDFDDIVENLSLLDGVYSDMMRHENILHQLKKMYLLRKTAYFGRVDFHEDGIDDTDMVYIGTSTLEGEKSTILIYDWRAAISSMFYECETGRAGFESVSGTIEGEILLKRQYRIFLDKIEAMFDSSIVIDDEILQAILSESKNSRMGTIVSSIQKEQNKAIRDENHRIVFVNGPAGSGKTSIALHRAAWLLYRYRDKMKAKNIIVYSPNDIFNDYISDVLPELGEENMRMSTFMKLAETYLEGKYRFEDYYNEMEGILTGSRAIDRDAVREKGSAVFAREIEDYVSRLSTSGFDFADISYNGNILAEHSELETLFYKDYSIHPIATRLEKIFSFLEKRLVNLTRRIRKNYVEVAKGDQNEGKKAAYIAKGIIDEVRKISYDMTHPDPFDLYNKFLAYSEKRKYTSRFRRSMETGHISYEDLAPVMYLKLLLGYGWDFEEIKHVIIDEVQDYSHIEMLVFFKLFRNIPMTLLGDSNQAINHLTDTNDMNISTAPESYTVKLEKSYRSTRQITRFCIGVIIDTAG